MIVVLGATGYLGNALIRQMQLEIPQIDIRAVGRNRTKLRVLEKLPNVASTATWEQGQTLDDILKGADAVVDLAYNVSGIPSEVTGNAAKHGRALVRSAADQGVSRTILISSVAVYGEPTIRYRWDEAPAPNRLKPSTIYGLAKAGTEISAVKAARGSNTDLTILRCGHILGPASKMASNIATTIVSGSPVRLSELEAPSNATSVTGIVQTIIKLAQADAVGGVQWGNHVDMADRSYDSIVASIAESLSLDEIAVANPAKTNRRTRVLGILRSNQKRVLYLQSRLGKYDLGTSAALLKSVKRRIGGSMSLLPVSTPGAPNANHLVPLYGADRIGHSSGIAGPTLNDADWNILNHKVGAWLQATGFKNPAEPG